MMKSILSNWNNWYLLAVAMPLIMAAVRITRMKIRTTTFHDEETGFRIKAPSSRYCHARLRRGVYSYSPTLQVVMATCSVIMAVLMVLESHRGIEQLLMDVGRHLNPWLLFAVSMVTLACIMIPLGLEQWLQMRYCRQHGLDYEDEDIDEDELPHFYPNPVFMVGALLAFLMVLGLMTYDRPSFLSMLATVILCCAAYYKVMEIWYWFSQYLVALIMGFCRLVAVTALLAVRLYAYIYEGIMWLYDKLTAERQARILRASIQESTRRRKEAEYQEMTSALTPEEAATYGPDQWPELLELVRRLPRSPQ